MGGGGGYTPCGGGYSHFCDFSVSPSPFGLDFGTLDFGTSDLGLTIKKLAGRTSLSPMISYLVAGGKCFVAFIAGK